VYQSLITYAPRERERERERESLRQGERVRGTERLGEIYCEKVRERNIETQKERISLI
jgi:hypothetical protein